MFFLEILFIMFEETKSLSTSNKSIRQGVLGKRLTHIAVISILIAFIFFYSSSVILETTQSSQENVNSLANILYAMHVILKQNENRLVQNVDMMILLV